MVEVGQVLVMMVVVLVVVLSVLTQTERMETEFDEEGGDDDEKRLCMARAFLRELAAHRRSVRREHENESREEEGDEGEESDAGTEGEIHEVEDCEDAEEGDAALAALLRKHTDAGTPQSYRKIPASLGLRFRCFLRGHKLPVTCVAAPGMGDASEKQRQQDFIGFAQGSSYAAEASLDRHIYTGGKDCCILRWDLQEGKKVVFRGKRNDFHCGGHFRPVLGLCVAPDESFFCSVGADQLLRIWDYRTSTTKCIAALRGHSDAICSVKLNNWPSAGAGGGTGSSPYTGTQSFSSAGDIEVVTCGADKSLKLWNLALRACLNSYYGHTAPVTAMDVMLPNRPLTVGEDCTARSWKLMQDTHLVFGPHLTSVDACCYLMPSLFVCGTQGGVISLHSTLRKRPIAAVQQSPLTSKSSSTSGYSSMKGITAMAAVRRSEVFFAGTASGVVQMWRAKKRRKRERRPASLRLSSTVQVNGLVTSLCLTPSERALVAAVSKETRLGRWIVDKRARNGIAVISLVHQENTNQAWTDLEEEESSD
ncbi:U3 small nucleolar RNA-interacting protein 2-like [Ochotona princeps]|uniref:U3 small nucleolar RNA-interacting protein 2-like n=1 Tax=Ochotona princeps TaxID=9978 RepID=UPI002714AF4A|nr:U3 small nucleolar RNA-interacting protein 2-like [Ochotona princeps]